jgi:hypothetical protein
MSGPKCSQYELDQRIARQQAAAEEARRKEVERQRLEELRLIQEWTRKIERETHALAGMNSALMVAQSQFPSENFSQPLVLPPMPINMSSAALQAHFNLLAGMAAKAQALMRSVNQTIANAGMRRIISESSSHISDDVKSLEDWLSEIRSAKAGVSAATLEVRQSTAMRLMKGLEPDEQTAEVKRAVALFLEETHAPRIELLELELRIAVQHARQQIMQKRQWKTGAEALLLQLPTFNVPGLAELRDTLQRAACGLEPLDAALRAKAIAVQQAAENLMAERCAGDIAASALKELGFTVNESFSTLFVNGGEVFVQRPGSSEYFVAFDVNKENRQVTLRTVRDGDSAGPVSREMARRDIEAEKSFCNDFPKIINALAKEGIRTRLFSAERPGAKDMEVLDLSAAGRAKLRERPRSKPQTRKRSSS